MTRHSRPVVLLALVTGLLLIGCGKEADPTPKADPGALIPESYWAASAPQGALPVGQAKREGQVGETLVLSGRVKDFVPGRAMFTLTDSSLQPCSANEADSCETPWDYCCVESDVIAANTVSVVIRDEAGRPLKAGLAGFHGLDHLQEITVTGKLQRDDQGNVTLVAESFHR